MEKLNLRSETIYEIEVEGSDFILGIDLADLTFMDNLIEARPKVKVMMDELYKGIDDANRLSDEMDEFGLSERIVKQSEIMTEFFKKGRALIDSLFGDGASYALFGRSNRIDMFNQLFEQLDPHFEKMGIKVDKHYENIQKKYLVKSKERKELK